MLKGAPYNSQVFEFIDSMKYCPEDYKAVELIRIGQDDCSEPHWNSALKIVCRNVSARANGEFRPPSSHEVQLGLRAQSLWHSLNRLSDLLSGHSSSNDSDSSNDSSNDSDGPVPPKLTRQCAANPELQYIHRFALEAELNVARDTNYYKIMGLADNDCDSKWHKTLQQLKHSGDLIMPNKSHTAFYHKTNQWYKLFKNKSLVDILQRPLRFPIELFVNPNNSVIISQRPVNPKPPVSAPFVPITPPNSP